MPTPEGRASLIDNVLKVRGHEGTQELHVKSEEQCKTLLQEHFGLTINDHLMF
jgi:arylamine N-acetyltransferase